MDPSHDKGIALSQSTRKSRDYNKKITKNMKDNKKNKINLQYEEHRLYQSTSYIQAVTVLKTTPDYLSLSSDFIIDIERTMIRGIRVLVAF